MGEVTADREAVVPLALRGPGDQEVPVWAAIDTGFTGCLVLPLALVAELELGFRERGEFALADGSIALLDAYEARLLREGQERGALAVAAESEPLIEMSLLYGHRVTLEIVDGGAVEIELLM